MSEKVIIFGKAGWPFTEKARSAYGGTAKYFDVKSDSTKLEEMLKHSGGIRKVPVIIEEGKVTIGYGGAWGVWVPVVYREGNRKFNPNNYRVGVIIGFIITFPILDTRSLR